MRLLVSVRSVEEAAIALDAGVDLIDVKEPRRGPLGAADAEVIRGIVALAADRVPVSAALGELRDWNETPLQRLAELPRGLRFAKFGLAGAAETADWRECLTHAWNSLPAQVSAVAVSYADWRAAAAPTPQEVLSISQAGRCGALLLDTWDKSCGSVLKHWSPPQIRQWIEQARGAGRLSVVGGSLTPELIAGLGPLAPDYVAVRGAACLGDRSEAIDATRVSELVMQVRTL